MANDSIFGRIVWVVGAFVGLTEACSAGDDGGPHQLPSTSDGGPGAGGVEGVPPLGFGGMGTPPMGFGGAQFNTGGMGGPPPIGQGGAGTIPPGGPTPVIPPVTATCPAFTDGTINFMGLAGIRIAAGAKAPSPTAPILFYWHGTGSNSGEYATLAAPVANGVTSQGGVIVSFQGTTGGDLTSGTSIFGVGDLALVDQLLACAVRDHNIDPRRVYTMGCSAGGLFAGAMGTLRSSYVAAVAPNSGGWIGSPAWQDSHTPALMTVHGAPGRDVVIIDFSNSSAAADTGYKNHGGFVINCDTGGGHCGGGGLAADVWTFFQAHPFGVAPHPWSSLPAGFSSQCSIK